MKKNKLVFCIGISGSGKSFLRSQLEDKFGNKIKAICPDDLRKSVLGDINKQDENDKIFAIAANKTKESLKNNYITYFDATGLNWSQNKKSIIDYTENLNIEVLILFFMDSEDLELCKERIFQDLLQGKDRSKVPENISDKQHEKFMICMKNALDDDNIPSNWSIILYNSNEFKFILNLLKG